MNTISPMINGDSGHPIQSKVPSRFLTNVFLILGIVILVFSSRISDNTPMQYLVGSIAEIVLVLFAVLLIKIENISVARIMRIKRPGVASVSLALMAAPGLWMMGVCINFVSTLLLGYTTPTPPHMFPTTLGESMGLAVTAIIVAPICEELMFRGYVQRSY
ncbi:MAG: hypothetical protein P1S60_11135, partial [Anaerolineae bacterium]|nr:hypothetical protein [Anaerolineae bacterium]